MIKRARRITRKAASLAGAAALRRPVPLVASIELTRRCNLRCTYCGAGEAEESELDAADWARIIDDLAASGTLRVSFSGGEPLLHPALPELVELCARLGMGVQVNTNGTLPESLEPLLPRLSSVVVSLDGTEAVNDAVRGKGVFGRAGESLERTRRRGVPRRISAVLSTAALPELPGFLELLKRLSTPAIFQPVFRRAAHTLGDYEAAAPAPAELAAAMDALIAARRRGFPIINSESGLRYLRRWPGPAPIRCGGGRYFIRVLATGRMAICGRVMDSPLPRVDARDGVVAGMSRIGPIVCSGCWCANRLEFNLALRGDAGAALGIAARALSGRGAGRQGGV
jgi:MoaA/NifB/PqqE/SkfB family radical SAM enzyme